MIERQLTSNFLEIPTPVEIPFDPQTIAQVLRAKTERPSAKLIREAKELGIDLTKENVWEIFLFDDLKKVEGYLMLYPEKRQVSFHTRVHSQVQPITAQSSVEKGVQVVAVDVVSEAPTVTKYLGLGNLRIDKISKVVAVPAFGHVWFENAFAKLDIYHDCQHGFVTK